MGNPPGLGGRGRGEHAQSGGTGPRTPTDLSQVDRRRAQLWGISIFVLVALTVVVALLTLGRNLVPGAVRPGALAAWIGIVLIVGLALAFLLYVVQKERELRKLSSTLVLERERSAQLDARLEEEQRVVADLRDVDRVKNDLVATVSHELKTPLTGIIGASRTLARQGTRMTPEQHTRFIDMIERQGTRLLGLVEDALATSKIESGVAGLRRERVDVCELVRRVVDDLSHTEVGNDRSVVVEARMDRCEVWGDRAALHQVVGNLVENGLKYSSADTDVRVCIDDKPSEVAIVVADDGRGISAGDLGTIFDRFRRVDSAEARTAGGYGLGLYIVKNLVDQHGGDVDVDSERGRGTTFTVRLPKRTESRR